MPVIDTSVWPYMSLRKLLLHPQEIGRLKMTLEMRPQSVINHHDRETTAKRSEIAVSIGI